MDEGMIGPEDLLGHELFARMSTRARSEFVAFFGPRQHLAAGTVVCREGTVADRWWAVLHGTADVTVAGMYFATVGAGEVIGDVALLDGGVRSATVTARDDLVVTELDAALFERFLDEVPGFERALLRQMATRVRRGAGDPRRSVAGTTDEMVRELPGDLLSVLADPAFYQDPFPFYAGLREQHRMLWDDTLELWLAARYDDVRFVLRDRRFSNDLAAATPTEMLRARAELDREMGDLRLMTQQDGELHTRLRRLFSSVLSPSRIDPWRARVREIVEATLDDAAAEPAFDLVDGLAVPLPIRVISLLLGVPASDQQLLYDWSVALSETAAPALSPDQRARIVAVSKDFFAYIGDQLDHRRAHPGDDALSELVADAPGAGVDDAWLLHNVGLLYIAGHMTTASLLAGGFESLLEAPEQWVRLCSDPGVVNNAVEEMLRFVTPVPLMRRYATEDVLIGDITVRAGQSVVCCLAGANRDPRQFGGDAETVRVDRQGAHEHLSFAAGRHFCVGAGLARIEAQVTFEAVARRFPDMTRAGERSPWSESLALRIPAALQVTLAP